MKYIRRGTFETNSSSCHSITIFQDGKDWEDFKNHLIYINRGMYDMEEHAERVNFITKENRDEYIVSIDHLYDKLTEILNDTPRLINSHYVQYNEKDEYIFNYLKKNWSAELMMKILVGKCDDVICTPDKPIKVRYYFDNEKVYTYDTLTASDFYDFLFGYGRFSDELPDFYVYGDGHEWSEAKVKRFIDEDTGERLVIVIRDEEC